MLNILRGLNERFQFMSQLVTQQRPFPSFANVRADLRLAELNMAPPTAPPSALVASASTRPLAPTLPAAPRPPTGCWGASVWQPQRPWSTSPWWSRPRWLVQQPGWRTTVALLPKPLDRIHPHVAWVLPRGSSQSTTSHWSSPSAGPKGWCCYPWHVLLAGISSLLPGACPGTFSCMVSMGSPSP